MIYAYIDRNGKLCLRPVDPEGERELKELYQDLRQKGMEVIDIETEMPEQDYNQYQRERYGYGRQNKQPFGFSPTSYYPMPPDCSPQMHWPVIFPIWLERDGQGGGRGGQGGTNAGGSGSGNIGYRDNITRMERGEYDGRENPRDTGPRDTPRR
jgi:hypothetical protein